ncbi:MAG TPA: hypothetical protein VME17_03115 [Bryobacteraceae bacterium]|nr:hypothetical protein [Bryobacteraceae bacterium]
MLIQTIGVPACYPEFLLGFCWGSQSRSPLLYMAGWSNYFWSSHTIKEPIVCLTYAIWAFITEPFASVHMLAV